jgi:type IV pilus modification protein PilV
MRARGFTLVESLISLVVLSVGLLGAAASLLGSLVAHSDALRRATALELICDMADRIRANAAARAAYDTATAAPAAPACRADSPCDSAARAALDRAHFAMMTHSVFPVDGTDADIHFEPATGPAAPDRYEITLRFPARSQPGVMESVALTVLAYVPVAGA